MPPALKKIIIKYASFMLPIAVFLGCMHADSHFFSDSLYYQGHIPSEQELSIYKARHKTLKGIFDHNILWLPVLAAALIQIGISSKMTKELLASQNEDKENVQESNKKSSR